jgi:DNA-3-methyladenine glycosylase II
MAAHETRRGAVSVEDMVGSLDAHTFRRSALELAGSDGSLAGIVARHGLPAFWARAPGFATLLLLILEQQVSLASAKAAFDRVDARAGGVTPGAILALSDGELREDGFSRQKARYARALADALESGALDLDAMGRLPDEDVRRELIALPGIGPWTAEVYLLSALRRPDTWPVGDIALQEAARRALVLERRPSAAELDEIGERWRPHRATAARLLWHLYLSEPRRARR